MGYEELQAKRDIEQINFLLDNIIRLEQENPILEEYINNEDKLAYIKHLEGELEKINEIIQKSKIFFNSENNISNEEFEELTTGIIYPNDEYYKLIDKKIQTTEMEKLNDEALIKKNQIETNLRVIEEYNKLISNRETLINSVATRISNSRIANNSSSDLVNSAITDISIAQNDYKKFINELCIQSFGTPLLVTLITHDPNDIINIIKNIFEMSSFAKEQVDSMINYINNQKRKIEQNLVLSDKAIIDLIETTTGKNFMKQTEIHSKVRHTTGNSQLMDNNGSFQVIQRGNRNKYSNDSNMNIKKFNIETNGMTARKDKDMFSRDYPLSTNEQMLHESFRNIPMNRKKQVIGYILENLELCLEMYESFYTDGKGMVIPTTIKLSNGDEIDYEFVMNIYNLPHILGIHPVIYNGSYMYPEPVRKVLNLNDTDNALKVLRKIIKNKERLIHCNVFSDGCKLRGGLYSYDNTNWYESMPWESIILKTNAFIRGDFFKRTSLITEINPDSYLIRSDDRIERITLTPERFGNPALNQQVLTENDIRMLKGIDARSDWMVKGLTHPNNRDGTTNNDIWIPKTNTSWMGERIILSNGSKLKALEPIRYMLTGVPDDAGGIIKSIENEKVKRDYSLVEQQELLVTMALGLGVDNLSINRTIRNLFDQIEQQKRNEHSSSKKPKH